MKNKNKYTGKMEEFDLYDFGPRGKHWIKQGDEPILGNAQSILRDDLLSKCYECGYTMPTSEAGEFHKNKFGLPRQTCPCGCKEMLPDHLPPK